MYLALLSLNNMLMPTGRDFSPKVDGVWKPADAEGDADDEHCFDDVPLDSFGLDLVCCWG